MEQYARDGNILRSQQLNNGLGTQQANAATKRKEKDVMKLLVSDYEVVTIKEDTNNEFVIKMKGPTNSPYEGVTFFE